MSQGGAEASDSNFDLDSLLAKEETSAYLAAALEEISSVFDLDTLLDQEPEGEKEENPGECQVLDFGNGRKSRRSLGNSMRTDTGALGLIVDAASPSTSIADPTSPRCSLTSPRNSNADPTSPRTSLVSSTSSGTRRVRTLLAQSNLSEVDVTFEARQAVALKSLRTATFEDAQWTNAVEHIKVSDAWASAGELVGLISQGAKAFGFWQLSEEALQTLVKHLTGEPTSATPTLQRWVDALGSEGHDVVDPLERLRSQSGSTDVSAQESLQERLRRTSAGKLKCPSELERCDSIYSVVATKVGFNAPEAPEAWRPKLCLFLLVFLVANANAIEAFSVKYPDAIDFFGPPIYVARVCGIGILLWTAVLILTMSRIFFRSIVGCLPFRWVFGIIDQHKELHIFSAKMMMLFTVLHIIGHSVGTVPGLISHTLDEVNGIIGCANPDSTPGYFGVRMQWLEWPECPLESKVSFLGVLFLSTPGITGILLLLLFCTMGFTASEAQRKKRYNMFYYVHITGIPLWLVLLFVHGSNGWVGVGFPLVAFVCSVPAAIYSVDRISRCLRYPFCSGDDTNVVDVVIRPGRGGEVMGSLIYLSVRKPRVMWPFRAGMYAYLNLPSYAQWQWHPFTICSGKTDDTVDFILHAVGDWTCELARQCMEAYNEGPLPKIAMDGPFIAPTVTALTNEVVVAVGAGVGVTPFLSLMSTIIALLGDSNSGKRPPVKEAHFFWMTRSADELLFGRRLFTQIMSNSLLKGKVFLHLHVTQKEPEKDVAAYLFREAVRRQSLLDREVWLRASDPAFDSVEEGGGGRLGVVGAQTKIAPQLPWCWIHGGQEDVLYVKALVEAGSDEEQDSGFVAQMLEEKHWSMGTATAEGHGKDHGAKGSRGSTVAQRIARLVRRPRPVQSVEQVGGASPNSRGLFVRSNSGSTDSSFVPVETGWLPVVFGRPDFAKEISAIGFAWPTKDVHIYACGNDSLVQSLQKVRMKCNERARELASREGLGGRPQGFFCHFERFG